MSPAISKDRPLVIYGAGGATGRRIVALALRRHIPMVLAGRRASSFADLANRHGLPSVAAEPTDSAALARLAATGGVILNAAGPFAMTAVPIAKAAIEARTAYLDVSGEVDSFTALASLASAAQAARVPLLVGAGYGVAAGECLAAHLVQRVDKVGRLRLGLDTYVARRSAGATLSMIAGLRRGGYAMAGGKMVATAIADRPWRVATPEGSFLFAGAPLAEAWAVASSTGVPDVRAGIAVRPTAIPILKLVAGAMRIGPLARRMERRAAAARPAEEAQDPGPARPSTIVAEAWDNAGRCVRSMLTTKREGYEAAADIAVSGALALSRSDRPGFLTPAAAFGPGFILDVEGFERLDLD